MLGILRQLFAADLDAKAGACGHGDGAVPVGQLSARQDIVGQMVVMRIGGEVQVGQDGAQV